MAKQANKTNGEFTRAAMEYLLDNHADADFTARELDHIAHRHGCSKHAPRAVIERMMRHGIAEACGRRFISGLKTENSTIITYRITDHDKLAALIETCTATHSELQRLELKRQHVKDCALKRLLGWLHTPGYEVAA